MKGEVQMGNKLTFYIVRHGETLFNTQQLAQGWCDSPLTKDGVAQAAALGRGLAEIPFLAVYSSTAERAVDTAELALHGRNIPVNREKDFREMNFGVLEGKDGRLLFDDFEKRLKIGWKDVEGETWDELGERAARGIRRICEKFAGQSGNILISTHGMTIMQIAREFARDSKVYQDYENSEHRGLDNCSATLLEWEDGVFTLRSINDISYREAGTTAEGTES